MKAGFKPKLFTKKEWEDNRSPAAKGSGVGKALDVWQAKCAYTLAAMDLKQIAEAFAAATGVSKALAVAWKKCDPKAQKETIGGIAAYNAVVDAYLKALKATNVALSKRKALTTALSFPAVMADKELLTAFTVFAKKKAFIFEPLHTFILWQAKKYPDAVKLYGKDNDYNVSNETNKILLDAFGGGDRGSVDLKLITKAVKDVPVQLSTMLTDSRHYQGGSGAFDKYETFLALLDKRFPIVNFVI